MSMGIIRYKGNYTSVWVTAIAVVSFMVFGYFERGLDSASMQGVLIGICLILYMSWDSSNTFIKVLENRYVVNKGYKSFSHDKIDIFDIKYIYRVPAFPWKSGGSLLVMYIKYKDGKLKHSALREHNYSNKTLKSILEKLRSVNSSIELDPEYEKFLSGELGPQNPWGFNNIATENTKESVENRLKDKGEKW